MKQTKVKKGNYIIFYQGETYEAIKSEESKHWRLYKGVQKKQFLVYKPTLHECKQFIKLGYTPKNWSGFSSIPSTEIDKKYKRISTGTIWTVSDVVYSTDKGKWSIIGSYYNDSIDSGWNSFDADEWEDDFEEM